MSAEVRGPAVGASAIDGHVPAEPAVATGARGFTMGQPTLSRGGVDRSEDLRDSERALAAWPTARVLVVDDQGRAATGPDGTALRLLDTSAVGQGPPPGAVLLGAVDGVDHWAVTRPVAEEEEGVRWLGLREIGALLDDSDATLFTTAAALLAWHRGGGFCPRCGQASQSDPVGWSRRCPQGHQEFPRTDPAVIVLVHDGADRMVLARQPTWPIGRVSVLAGFVEAGESLEAAVVREIAEEIGVVVDEVAYLGSQPWPFPRSLMVGFAARADPDAPLRPRDGEIEDPRWVDRATVRALLARGGEWDARADDPDGAHTRAAADVPTEQLALPGSVSIAYRMIQSWAAAGSD